MPIPALLLTACFLWATSFIAIKITLPTVPPLTLVSLRLLVASLCYAPLLYRKRRVIFSGGFSRFVRLFVLSLFGTGLHYGLQTIGLQYTSASSASLWALTCPLLITLIGVLFLRERLTLKTVAGMALALAGVLCMLGPDLLRGIDLKAHALGDGLVFFSIFLWALFTVYGKSLSKDLGPLELLGSATVIGSLWMIPVGAWELWHQGLSLGGIPPQSWGAIVFLGAACGFAAGLLYFVALSRTDSQKVGVYLYTSPPMAYVVAWAVLGEKIGPTLLMGSALIAAGVYLTEKSRG